MRLNVTKKTGAVAIFNDEVIYKSLRTVQWKHLLCAWGPVEKQTKQCDGKQYGKYSNN